VGKPPPKSAYVCGRLSEAESTRCYAGSGERIACERAGKSGKQIERCIISTFQVAESLGFKGRLSSLGALAADSRVSSAGRK
jgi:hypothetical protein